MKPQLLKIIVCPKCKNPLSLSEANYENEEIKEGMLKCNNGCRYFIKNFIPRFVESDEYAKSFSFEWNKHKLTQFDSHNKDNVSEKNFKNHLANDLNLLKGKLVLDAGCGSGRYAEIAAKYGARVIATDLSYSVDFARENLKNNKNIDFIQADIFNLPFDKNTFDFIYSLGVLHHTPDCKNAFKELSKKLKKGGIISIFVYASYNKIIVYSSNFWRLFTTKMPKKSIYYLSFLSIPLYHIYIIPIIGHVLKAILPLSMEKNPMIRALDTFDWYSPKYQSKHTHSEVAEWFKEENLKIIAIPKGEISLVGVKQ